jgi:hypothetical protein
MRFPPEFGIQRHAQVFRCVLIWNNVVVDIDWLVLDTLVGEIDGQKIVAPSVILVQLCARFTTTFTASFSVTSMELSLGSVVYIFVFFKSTRLRLHNKRMHAAGKSHSTS